ncbi:MAG: cellulose biosynthesis cyclic di-GMP-binding regulatory protein BcsB [Gammaproteobacteria bacterium]|nr:cellulose biosynthesis cyclic di-GMP-binding regulatory protein BcsB [Gammaproteobacteria bacterium]
MSCKNFTFSKTRFFKYLFLFLFFPSAGFGSDVRITSDSNGIKKPGGQVLTSLKDLGNETGIRFESAVIGHEEKLTYSVPHDTKISSASIHLRYETSQLLNKGSTILLLVNGYPLEQVQLTDEKYRSEFQVDIPVNLIQPGTLDITIKVTLLTLEEDYLASHMNGALLYIESDSTLTIGYQGDISSLRDAWVLLPKKVILTVPERSFSEDEYYAVWGIMDHLYRQGKEISITHYPEIGHLVFGDRSRLKKQLLQELPAAQAKQEGFDSFRALDDSMIMLVSSPLRSVISITKPAEVSASALMNNSWQKLVAGDQYKIFTTDSSEKFNYSDDVAYEIRLSDFGMDTSTRYIWGNTEWELLLDPLKMPAGTRPAMLFLDLIVPPSSNKAAFSLYTYLNDIMIHAQHLDDSGDVQRLQIPLPARYQQLYNNLRIQILNTEARSIDFQQGATTFPIQILPESALILERNTTKPKRFVDLPAYLADQFDFYLPSAYLDSPDESLLFTAAFTANFPVPFAHRKATFVQPGSILTPARPFIALGDVVLSELNAPVRFDQGVIDIRDRKNESLLQVDKLSGIAIAQLVTSNGQHGLWLRSGDNNPYPDVRRLFLNEDDVAFADRSGLLFSLNSTEPTLARVHYPTARNWLVTVSEYRFWIMVFVWLILTLGIVYLFRRRRQHQNNT